MQSEWRGSLLPFWRFFETGCNQGQCLTDSSQEPHRWAVLINSSHCLNVWWQHWEWYLHYFCMDLHLHTEQKQELLRHKWHIYTLKQQGPVTDEHTAFMPAVFTKVPAEQFFTACCCCLFSLTLTIYSHLIPPKSLPSCRISCSWRHAFAEDLRSADQSQLKFHFHGVWCREGKRSRYKIIYSFLMHLGNCAIQVWNRLFFLT